MVPAGACIVVTRNSRSYRTRDLPRPSPTIYSGLGTGLMMTHLIKSHHLAICMMKSNIVIVGHTYLEMSLHSSDHSYFLWSEMDRDAELATLRNPPNRHCDVFNCLLLGRITVAVGYNEGNRQHVGLHLIDVMLDHFFFLHTCKDGIVQEDCLLCCRKKVEVSTTPAPPNFFRKHTLVVIMLG